MADFSGNPTAGSAPLTVNFTDQSTGDITSWSWDFGDGETSTDQGPTHIYKDTGTYTVSITITGPGGTDTETKTDYITVTGNRWVGAYKTLFSDRSDLRLLRRYRDQFLTKTFRGRLFTNLLYRNSEEALQILLDNPYLMKKARHLIKTNRNAVIAALKGNKGTIYNTDEIVFFLAKFARKAPPDLRRLAIAVKREMVRKQRHGRKFLGFRLALKGQHLYLNRGETMPQQIIAKELESELMLYETEKDSVHLLNPTARLVYNLYKKGKELTEIEQEMQRNFQVDDSRDLRGDLLRCLEELRSKKLVGTDD